MPPATLERLKAYIEKTKWTFAKTMPQWPHWYTVREWAPELDAECVFFSECLCNYGYDERHGKRDYRYLDIGEFKYWFMDDFPAMTILINRAKL